MIFFIKTRESKILEKNYLRLKQVQLLSEKYETYPQSQILETVKRYIKSTSQYSRKEFKKLYKSDYEEMLVNMHAIVREVAKRVLGLKQYDQQILGSLCMTDNCIIEMKTGEGKTLTCVSAASFKAIFSKGVHIATANDYLAKRDCDTMSPVYNYMGLSVGCVINSTPHNERKSEFAKDVTYITNSEVGFSSLRDNMKFSVDEIAMRGLIEIINDEADHHLIDSSKVPYVISSNSNEQNDEEMWKTAKSIVDELEPHHFTVEERRKVAYLTSEGFDFIEKALRARGVLDVFSDENSVKHLFFIDKLLKATKIMQRDKDYVVKNDKVFVVDEFTGRTYDNRKFSEGMHQAIETKEGMPVTGESRPAASITIQSLMRKYVNLSGMTGTAYVDRSEFSQVYGVDVVRIPTIEEKKLKRHDPLFFVTKKEKFKAIIEVTKSRHYLGQPILIGTTSIKDSELLSDMLNESGIKHNVLNAIKHEAEAKIIAEAGLPFSITISTNMSGRGTHVPIGGDPEFIAQQSEVKDDEEMKKIKDECEKRKKEALSMGGLLVIIAGLSESKRVELQIEGRAARRGEMGESMYYFSCEDDVVKPFISSSTSSQLRNLDPEGRGIKSKIMEKVFYEIQRKAEEMASDARKHLMSMDLVIDAKRNIFHEMRMNILKASEKEMLNILVLAMVKTGINDIEQCKAEDRALITKMLATCGITPKSSDVEIKTLFNLVKNINLDNLEDREFLSKKYTAIKQYILDYFDFLWKEFLFCVDCTKNTAFLKTLKNRHIIIAFSMEIDAFFQQMLKCVRLSIFASFVYFLDSFKKTKNVLYKKDEHLEKILKNNINEEELLDLINKIKHKK